MALQIPLNLQILARQNVCIPLTVMALGLYSRSPAPYHERLSTRSWRVICTAGQH
jgi:hypothetical protein